VRHQVVPEGDGLCVLKVSATRHGRVEVPVRLLEQRVDHVEHLTRDQTRVPPQIHAGQCRDLVVARPSGAQLSAELGADGLDQ